MSTFGERARLLQLRTLQAIGVAGPVTPEQVAQQLGGVPAHVARRLRRYARRGWLGRQHTEHGVRFYLRSAGAQRVRWIRESCGADS